MSAVDSATRWGRLLAAIAISFSRNPFVANDGARAIGANDDDDDAAAAAPALDSNQLRGHRQQLAKFRSTDTGLTPWVAGAAASAAAASHHRPPRSPELQRPPRSGFRISASSYSAAQAAPAGRAVDRRSDRRGPEPNFSDKKQKGGYAARGVIWTA